MSSVDFAYLESFVAHDADIVREVLALFREQAENWALNLSPETAEWRDVVHTIKGAARGVGARALGDACEHAELGGESELSAVKAQLDAAVADIAAYQSKAA